VSEPADSVRHARLLRAATYASVATALLLVAAKLAAWFATGSVSVLASLADSLMDVGASLVNLLAVAYSLQPADDEHRFGHGKAEALAGLAQATFGFGSAVFVVFHALDRLFNPAPLDHLGEGIAVLAFAMLASIALLAFQRHVIRRTGSTAIRADALHYASDLATNGATILALALASAGLPGLDPVFGVAIALYIAWSAITIGRTSVRLLMDRELPPETRDRIARAAEQTPGVSGVHGLRTWQSGPRKVIQLHIELDPNLKLIDAHRIALAVERRILEREPDADVTIHQDPAGLRESGNNPGDRFD
jgi:ferrous-iron efflux pump FieF